MRSPGLTELDPDLAYLIALEEGEEDPDSPRAEEDVNPCAIGVPARWVADFTDAAGFRVTGATSADLDTNRVCFDYAKPDVVLARRPPPTTTRGSPRLATRDPGGAL